MKILETYQYNAGDGPVVYRRGVQTEYEEVSTQLIEFVIVITTTLFNSQGSLADWLIEKTYTDHLINSNHEMLASFDENGKSE